MIDNWILFPWWSAWCLYGCLGSQGHCITLSHVKQIGRESGWTHLRHRLRSVCRIDAENFWG